MQNNNKLKSTATEVTRQRNRRLMRIHLIRARRFGSEALRVLVFGFGSSTSSLFEIASDSSVSTGVTSAESLDKADEDCAAVASGTSNSLSNGDIDSILFDSMTCSVSNDSPIC
mmetsp:Transcript_22094/g.46606  ORF Transcript_22094/g.46606 Transcript_22094/m.46606 type:complete len:114 (-) Transcript_22094:2112-2453(-)